ncbi:MAG: Hsp20 family protein [Bauldia sp.]|nr:Hsp20 family protein [Bauldia sp.]
MSGPGLFSSSILLGFEEVERALEQVTRKGGDGYPPYNVERLAPADGRGETLRIVLAVAGFSPDDLTVTADGNQLIVQGRQSEEKPRDYLHRGIAARRFRRSFLLAAGVEVGGATLKDGLLAIDLQRPFKERGVQRVAINGASRGTAEPGGN